jgi:hypothetical protein
VANDGITCDFLLRLLHAGEHGVRDHSWCVVSTVSLGVSTGSIIFSGFGKKKKPLHLWWMSVLKMKSGIIWYIP